MYVRPIPGLKRVKSQKSGGGSVWGRRTSLTCFPRLTSPGNGKPPLPQLYRNDGHGKFQDVAERAGLTQTGWAQGVCVGDYDNDGRPDMFVTYYGHNVLYHNSGKGTFTDATASAKLPVTGTRWGTGCAFVDYDRDGLLDIFGSNYVAMSPRRAGSLKPGGRYGLGVLAADFDDDGDLPSLFNNETESFSPTSPRRRVYPSVNCSAGVSSSWTRTRTAGRT